LQQSLYAERGRHVEIEAAVVRSERSCQSTVGFLLGGQIVDQDDGLTVDHGRVVVFVSDERLESVLIVPKALDDFDARGDAIADADGAAELEVLREVDRESRKPREGGTDEPGDKRAVDDAFAKSGFGCELFVEVESVRVAADSGERPDVLVGERLLEGDGVADADVVRIVDSPVELPV